MVCRALPALLLLALAACASAPTKAPYPHESVLTVVAELKIFLDQDPYRQPPGEDLNGRNIFRVSLERLKALQPLTGPEYADVLDFAKGQCLERLGEWTAAREAFESAADRATSLAPTAREHAANAARMAGLTDRSAFTNTLEGYLNDLEVLERRLKEWQQQSPPWPYDAYLRQAGERAQEERVQLLFTNRLVLEGAIARMIKAAQTLTQQYQDSYRISAHWIQLGSIYETLARDWADRHPPESSQGSKLGKEWLGLVEQARQAYQHVARADGDPAKPEGQARLRALDAYALRVQALAR
jgi:hypothetical protein